MGKRHRKTRTKAKKNSPCKLGDKVSFLGGRVGIVTTIRSITSKFGTAYDITITDVNGKQHYVYGGQIDYVIRETDNSI